MKYNFNREALIHMPKDPLNANQPYVPVLPPLNSNRAPVRSVPVNGRSDSNSPSISN